MGLLSREQILKADDLKSEVVPTPEWGEGGEVRIGAMTGTGRDEFEASCYDGKGKDFKVNFINLRAKLIVRTAINDKGERLFSDADVVAVGGKACPVLDRLFTIAQRLNGIGQKEVDELTKN